MIRYAPSRKTLLNYLLQRTSFADLLKTRREKAGS
jgi:hypothetical protein